MNGAWGEANTRHQDSVHELMRVTDLVNSVQHASGGCFTHWREEETSVKDSLPEEAELSWTAIAGRDEVREELQLDVIWYERAVTSAVKSQTQKGNVDWKTLDERREAANNAVFQSFIHIEGYKRNTTRYMELKARCEESIERAKRLATEISFVVETAYEAVSH
jgi:hypothetical protein